MQRSVPIVLFGMSSLCCSCANLDPHGEPVTAQRPTVSADTATTGAGTFEVESGLALDPGHEIDTPTTLKWGIGPRTEVFLGGSPYQAMEPERDAVFGSDLLVGMRHRFLEEAEGRPSAAFQLATNVPTGNRGEGWSSGEIDFHAAGMLTKTFGHASATAYYDFGLLGDPAGGQDIEHTVALAGAVALNQRWGAFAEVASVFPQHRSEQEHLATVGGSYAFSPTLVIDLGAAVGLNDEAADFQLLLGFTMNLGGFGR